MSHPGPADRQRVQIAPCRAHPLRLRLKAGLPLDRAIAAAAREAGVTGAWLQLDDLLCTALSFVIPAPPPATAALPSTAPRVFCAAPGS